MSGEPSKFSSRITVLDSGTFCHVRLFPSGEHIWILVEDHLIIINSFKLVSPVRFAVGPTGTLIYR